LHHIKGTVHPNMKLVPKHVRYNFISQCNTEEDASKNVGDH